MCMQFTLDKIPSKIVLFTTGLLLVIPCSRATNSACPGVRQSTTDSAQHVYQIRTPFTQWTKASSLFRDIYHHIVPKECN